MKLDRATQLQNRIAELSTRIEEEVKGTRSMVYISDLQLSIEQCQAQLKKEIKNPTKYFHMVE